MLFKGLSALRTECTLNRDQIRFRCVHTTLERMRIKVTGYNLLINIHEDCLCSFFSPACSYKDELHAKHEGTPGIIHRT